MNVLLLRGAGLKTRILYIFQTVILLCIFNFIIASYNGRYMLYEPYKDILDSNGYYFSLHLVNAEPDYNLSEVFDNLQGDCRFLTFRGATPMINDDEAIRLIILEDGFYDKMNLPLEKGRKKESSGAYGIISPNSVYKTGDYVHLKDFDVDIKVCGELTDPTYRPTLSVWSNGGNISTLYPRYAEYQNDMKYLIMPLSSFDIISAKLSGTVFAERNAIMYYGSRPTASEHEANYEILSHDTFIDELESIRIRTESFLKDDLYKYLPLALLTLVISVVGIISNTVIYILRQSNKYAVLYLCGMDWKGIISITALNSTLNLAVSAATVLFIAAVSKGLGLSNEWGMVFKLNNLCLSSALLILMFIFSLAVPAVIIRKQSPIDIIRSEK